MTGIEPCVLRPTCCAANGAVRSRLIESANLDEYGEREADECTTFDPAGAKQCAKGTCVMAISSPLA